jgi:hypothetical protein
MNGLDEIGIAGEGWKGGHLRGLEEHRPIVWLSLKIRAWEPGERLVEGMPDPRDRVQLRTIG